MAGAEKTDAGLNGPGMTDRLRAGEWSAVEQVYRALSAEVWRSVYERLGRDRHGADEVTSEVFLAVVKDAHRFDPARSNVEGWVFGIARRKLADYLRRVYRERKRTALLEARAEASRHASPRSDTAEALWATLDRIEPQQRQLLLWKYRDGLSTRQIAERMRRSEKACENLLYRARKRFKALYASMMETSTP